MWLILCYLWITTNKCLCHGSMLRLGWADTYKWYELRNHTVCSRQFVERYVLNIELFSVLEFSQKLNSQNVMHIQNVCITACLSLSPHFFSFHLRYVSIHCGDVMICAITSQINTVSIVCSTVCSSADQRKHQSSASLVFVRGFPGHRWIPLTKRQWRGKCFHFMAPSCSRKSLPNDLAQSMFLFLTWRNGVVHNYGASNWGKSGYTDSSTKTSCFAVNEWVSPGFFFCTTWTLS